MLTGMTSSEIWDEAAAAVYDADCADMFSPAVLDPTVEFLARLADGGPALELAIGTGRVALPLLGRGISVSGIELSVPMVDQLRRKIDAPRLPVTIGDMATTQVPGRYSLVYLVFNSISNLRTQAEQVECFRNAARHLRPGGRFVVELWVPPIRRLPPGQHAAPMKLDGNHLVFDTYDLATQQCTSHHYLHRANGTIDYYQGNFRYIWPAECDLMAQLAGMTLESRHADWLSTPFTSASESHVSVWRLP
jgi:SAM-dependent methyltransferase